MPDWFLALCDRVDAGDWRATVTMVLAASILMGYLFLGVGMMKKVKPKQEGGERP